MKQFTHLFIAALFAMNIGLMPTPLQASVPMDLAKGLKSAVVRTSEGLMVNVLRGSDVVGRALLTKTPVAQLMEYSPKALEKTIQATKSGLIKGKNGAQIIGRTTLSSLRRFPMEAFTFFIAIGAVSAAQFFLDEGGNPMVFEQHLNSGLDPVGNLGFAAFMVTSGLSAEAFKAMGTAAPSRIFVDHIGMGAGMLASHIVAEVAHFPGFKECIKSSSRSSLACQTAYENWVKTDMFEKLHEFAPGLMSLVVSNVSAMIVQMGLQVAKRELVRILGINLITALAPGGLAVKGFQFIGKVGQFFVFVGIDTLIQQPIRFAYSNVLQSGDLRSLELHLQRQIRTAGAEKFTTKDIRGYLNTTKNMFEEWREMNLTSVRMAESNWSMNLEKYSAQYNATYNFYSHFLEEIRQLRFGSYESNPKLSILNQTFPLNGVSFDHELENPDEPNKMDYLLSESRYQVEEFQTERLQMVANSYLKDFSTNGPLAQKLASLKCNSACSPTELKNLIGDLLSEDNLVVVKALQRLTAIRDYHVGDYIRNTEFGQYINQIVLALGDPKDINELGSAKVTQFVDGYINELTQKGPRFRSLNSIDCSYVCNRNEVVQLVRGLKSTDPQVAQGAWRNLKELQNYHLYGQGSMQLNFGKTADAGLIPEKNLGLFTKALKQLGKSASTNEFSNRQYGLFVHQILTQLGKPKPMMTPGDGYLSYYGMNSQYLDSLKKAEFPKSVEGNKGLLGFLVPDLVTKNPVEYLVAQMVWGPRINQIQYYDKNVNSSYFGSSTNFVPPALLEDGSSIQIATCTPYPTVLDCPVSVQGKKYSSLFRYLVEMGFTRHYQANLSPFITAESTGFEDYWKKTGEYQYVQGWTKFEPTYQEVVAKLVDALWEKDGHSTSGTFSNSVYKGVQAATNNGPVSNGVLKSLEQEYKLYLTILGEFARTVKPGMKSASKPRVFRQTKWDKGIIGNLRNNDTLSFSMLDKALYHPMNGAKATNLQFQEDLLSQWYDLLGKFDGMRVATIDWKSQGKKVRGVISRLTNQELAAHGKRFQSRLQALQTELAYGVTNQEQQKNLQALMSALSGVVNNAITYVQIANMVSLKELKGQENQMVIQKRCMENAIPKGSANIYRNAMVQCSGMKVE